MVCLVEYHRELTRLVSQDELRLCRARHEFGCRGARLRGQHAIEDGSGVLAVFGPVGRVDFVVDVAGGVHEGDVLLDATGPNPTFVCLLDATAPGRLGPLDGSDVEAVAVGDDPDGHRLSKRPVAPE